MTQEKGDMEEGFDSELSSSQLVQMLQPRKKT